MTSIPRPKLLALLAQFHISPVAFDALRADAYEKHLAARSLAELAQFYEILFNPALTYRQMRPICPPWGLKKYGGKHPSIETLREIKQRVSLEQHLHHLATTSGLLDSLKTAAPDDPDKQRVELLNAAVAMLSQELLFAKLEGKPILENLRVVDRLLRVESLRVRRHLHTPPAKAAKDKPLKKKSEKPTVRRHNRPPVATRRTRNPSPSRPLAPATKPQAPRTKRNHGKNQGSTTGPDRADHLAPKYHKLNAIGRNHVPENTPYKPGLVNPCQP